MNTAGFAEENKTKPEISRKIAELANCVDPENIVSGLVNAVERGDSEYSVGVDGWFCTRATVGFGPVTSVFNCLIEGTRFIISNSFYINF